MDFIKIRNGEELLSHGDVSSRQLVLEVADQVLLRLDSCDRLKSMVRREGSWLSVGRSRRVNLDQYRRVYAFSAGKAANHMARAFEEILGDRLTQGVAIVKIKEDRDVFAKTEVFVGGHPLPEAEGVAGSRRMVEIAEQMDEQDLLLLGLSGGCSALMGYPVEGITLEDLRQATDVMLKSGMNVMDINDIRAHLCRMSRGRLGRRIRGAEILCFEIWDAVGLDHITDYNQPVPIMGTPVGFDTVSFSDIREKLKVYGLEDRLPRAVVRYLKEGGEDQETPKTPREKVEYYIVNTLADSCKIAMEAAAEKGIPAVTLTTYAEGESKDFGTLMAAIAREVMKNGRPFQRPCLVFSAGETTTRIADNSSIKGHGGPSQELVCGFALGAEEIPGACMLSMDSEGTDGTTDAAGGLTDSRTAAAARAAGINLRQALEDHGTHEALRRVGDCVMTGNTGTNLCDFNILYIPQ